MHAPPAFQLSVYRFGIWRGVCGLMALLVLATLAMWWFSASAVPHWLAWPAAGCLVPLWSAARTPGFSLRWDTQCWHLGPPAARGQEPMSGQVQVALDFGAWMLLCFQPADGAMFRRRVHWLPLQRFGHESAWHALRCTVHAAHTDDRRHAVVH